MSTNVPDQLEGTDRSPRAFIAEHFGSPSMENTDNFGEWMQAAWCSEETIRRLSGV